MSATDHAAAVFCHYARGYGASWRRWLPVSCVRAWRRARAPKSAMSRAAHGVTSAAQSYAPLPL
jgi:hypothetical protein